MASETATALVAGGSKKKQRPPAPPPLLVPLWRLITVEATIYAVCHVFCLGLVLFAVSDASLSDLTRGLLRQLRGPPQEVPPPERSPFEVLRDYREAAAAGTAAPSHEVSSDLLITMLLPFSLHAFFLALMRRLQDVVEDETKRREGAAGTAPSQAEAAAAGRTSGDAGAAAPRPWWMVNCDTVVKNTFIGLTSVLCILVPVSVLSQKASEVRGLGPAASLMSIAVGLCALEGHGGVRSLQKLFNGLQAINVVVLVVLVAVANLCPKE
ncbi:uncharacterized protein Tco025E_03010 [Trypanosoma conorhini]|uniref:Uncharacterized protein n=1 Tax=Trypanosoma conorhini TaxID=83891 RepID=A0A422PY71_9TRYP|nr:uncharacterized protein Tco025E_03010 [Trypanosoma conorhini]RNF22683.1 hypothetical protein Tco025E_03010 [Trypanosoma conorhini]